MVKQNVVIQLRATWYGIMDVKEGETPDKAVMRTIGNMTQDELKKQCRIVPPKDYSEVEL